LESDVARQCGWESSGSQEENPTSQRIMIVGCSHADCRSKSCERNETKAGDFRAKLTRRFLQRIVYEMDGHLVLTAAVSSSNRVETFGPI
jgi:hypothetical protein